MASRSLGRAEWHRGWPIVLGAMACSGLGVPLFYYVFSVFLESIRAEFSISRGEMANVQALLVVGAMVAPLIGRWLDRFGFRKVFAGSGLLMLQSYCLLASTVSSIWGFALVTLIIGAAGIGGGPLAYTRPINAWFWHNRGLALGLAAIGLAVTSAAASPLLAALIDARGWRAGMWALAIVFGCVCMPLTLLLMRNAPPDDATEPISPDTPHVTDKGYAAAPDFWLLCGAMICMAIPGAGLLGQLSPIVQDEGIGSVEAALGITAFASGQVTGRIVGGWCLDRAPPRTVALLFTLVPSIGFFGLAAADLPLWGALFAVGLVGIQQGAEIDLFAWFVARRFGLGQYGAVYGWIIAVSWIGNALGLLMFGWLAHLAGSFTLAEWVAGVLLVIGSVLIGSVRVTRLNAQVSVS